MPLEQSAAPASARPASTAAARSAVPAQTLSFHRVRCASRASTLAWREGAGRREFLMQFTVCGKPCVTAATSHALGLYALGRNLNDPFAPARTVSCRSGSCVITEEGDLRRAYEECIDDSVTWLMVCAQENVRTRARPSTRLSRARICRAFWTSAPPVNVRRARVKRTVVPKRKGRSSYRAPAFSTGTCRLAVTRVARLSA